MLSQKGSRLDLERIGLLAKGKIVAVATIFRDRQSLEVELAMERGEGGRLEELVRG